jgi:hypothetical protein
MRAPLLLSLVPLLGCATATGPEEAPPAVASPAGTAAIAKLVSRDRSITLLAGHGTVRATVLDGSGNLIAREIPIDDLQAIDATAYEACHGSFAGAEGASGRLDQIGGNAASTALIRGE